MERFYNIVNGRPVDSAEYFHSANPATGEKLGLVPQSTEEEVALAVEAAKAAQPAWAARTDSERGEFIQRVADVFQQNSAYLAEWVTREQGKPLGGVGPGQVPGSLFEIWACETWTRATAEIALPVDVVFEDANRRDEVHRKPYGVVAAVAPWNWPLMIAVWQIIPAIRAGNAVVIKPSEYTSIASLEMLRIIADVLPPGVINTVSGGGAVGAWLVENRDIAKIMFTGSNATGSRIAAVAARNIVPTTMELGGNDAAIVLPDADPRAVATGVFWGAFLNMGQTCAAIKRLYVHEALHDAVVDELKTLVEGALMGNGMAPGVMMGPVQNRPQYEKIKALVDDARARGATIVCGGNPIEGPGNFYPLTLVTDIEDGAPLVDEEQFGPVLPVLRYRDVEAAIESANRIDVGLGASVWGSDLARAYEVANRIEAGTVWINQHGAVHPMVPFGGVKRSGWGVEFGVEGLKSITQSRVISIGKPSA